MSPTFHRHDLRSKSLERSSSHSSLNSINSQVSPACRSQPDKTPSPFPLILGSPRSVKNGHRWSSPRRLKLPRHVQSPVLTRKKRNFDPMRTSNESLDSTRDIFRNEESDSESIIPSSQPVERTFCQLSKTSLPSHGPEVFTQPSVPEPSSKRKKRLCLSTKRNKSVKTVDRLLENSSISSDSMSETPENCDINPVRETAQDSQNGEDLERDLPLTSSRAHNLSNVSKNQSSENEDRGSVDDLSIFENDLTLSENRKLLQRASLTNCSSVDLDSSDVNQKVKASENSATSHEEEQKEVSFEDLAMFEKDLTAFFPDNDEIVSGGPQESVNEEPVENKAHVEGIQISSESDSDEETDLRSLSGDYYKGKSKAIVAKYRLNDADLTEAQIRERVGRMIRDLKYELALSDEMILKLTRLNIEVPEVHENHKVKKLWLYRKGNGRETVYSTKEISIIMSNWRQFRKTYGFKQKDARLFLPYSYWIQNENFRDCKIRFAQFLAQKLPRRTVKSVYMKFADLLNRHEPDGILKFTPSDDFLIRLVHQCHPRCSISILKYLLHLPDRDITMRIKLNKPKFTFTNAMKRPATRSSSTGEKYDGCRLWSVVTLALSKVLRDLNYHRQPEASTSLDYPAWTRMDKVWTRLEKETSIPVLALKKIVFTRLLPMAVNYGFVGRKAKRVKHFELKISMIEKLFQERRWKWEEVDWAEVSNSLGGVGPVFVYSLFRKAVKKYVPPNLWNRFRSVVEYMSEKVLPVYREAAQQDNLYLRMIPQFYKIITPDPVSGKFYEHLSDTDSE